ASIDRSISSPSYIVIVLVEWCSPWSLMALLGLGLGLGFDFSSHEFTKRSRICFGALFGWWETEGEENRAPLQQSLISE
ncbi:hypothetical protein U1Q18_007079, partial [Sarracenia purpurea var. burkii]